MSLSFFMSSQHVLCHSASDTFKRCYIGSKPICFVDCSIMMVNGTSYLPVLDQLTEKFLSSERNQFKFYLFSGLPNNPPSSDLSLITGAGFQGEWRLGQGQIQTHIYLLNDIHNDRRPQ